MIFWELSKYVFKFFLAQLGPILEGGGCAQRPTLNVALTELKKIKDSFGKLSKNEGGYLSN